MMERISLGSALLMMLSGLAFSALIIRHRNVDDAGFAIVLAGLVLVSTLPIAGLIAKVARGRLRADGASQLD